MKISRNHKDFSIVVNEDDLRILIAGLRESLQELEAWEFSTRVGYTQTEVQKVLDLLLDAMRQDSE